MNLSTIESPAPLRLETSLPPFWRLSLLALLSVGLTALSAPHLPLGWLGWIGLVPLGLALRRANRVGGFILAGLFGWGFWFGVIWWVQTPMREILSLSPLVALALTLLSCAFLALPYAIAGWLVGGPRGDGNALLHALKFAAVFTVATSWFPQLFDVNLAHSQFEHLHVLQVLDFGGTALLLFIILLVNGLVVEMIAGIKTGVRAAAKPGLALIVTFVLLFSYGEFRLVDLREQMKTAPAKSWFTVGAVQPNIPVLVPAERQPVSLADRTNDFFSALQQAVALVKKHPEIDLLALPENPDLFVFNTDEKRRTALADTILQIRKPVMLNAALFDASKPVAGNPGRYNVNVFIDSTAFVTNSYRKMKLVPLIETLPGEDYFPALRQLFPRSLGVIPGPKPVVFDVKPGVRVIPLICYEGTSSTFTRRFIELGGNSVVNLINDSWFLRTPGAKCHMALAPFRAVEFRVPFVRVSNSGVGGYVQPTGEIIPGSETALFEKVESAFRVFIPAERSFYAKHGDWFLVLLTFVLLGAFVVQAARCFSPRSTRSGDRVRHRRKRRTFYYS